MPKYLYHGSRQKVTYLTPSQALGYSSPSDNEYGIYAVAERELAIPFAISFRPLSDNAVFSVDTSSRPPRILLIDTKVDWEKVGYIYKVSGESFELVAEDQWVSTGPVAPVSVEEVNPKSYRHWIELNTGEDL
ncbi:MAG: hypothetical protein WCY88_12055 [Spongiibacteraceae bacterium]